MHDLCTCCRPRSNQCTASIGKMHFVLFFFTSVSRSFLEYYVQFWYPCFKKHGSSSITRPRWCPGENPAGEQQRTGKLRKDGSKSWGRRFWEQRGKMVHGFWGEVLSRGCRAGGMDSKTQVVGHGSPRTGKGLIHHEGLNSNSSQQLFQSSWHGCYQGGDPLGMEGDSGAPPNLVSGVGVPLTHPWLHYWMYKRQKFQKEGHKMILETGNTPYY